MAESEQNTALPLNEAAARFGITPDALRMRLRRGKVRGFKRDRRLFVYLDDLANIASEQHNGRCGTEDRADRDASAGRRGVGRPAQRSELAVVIEFQKIELNRIVRENERLNRRVEELLEELRHLREIQQREQILRQQDQTLRAQGQNILEQLIARLGLPAPAAPPEQRAAGTVVSPPGADSEAPTGARREPPSEARPAPAAFSRPPTPPEPVPEVALDSAAGPKPTEPSRPAHLPLAEEDTAALAEILREAGESLRESLPTVHSHSGDESAGERRPPPRGASLQGRPSLETQMPSGSRHGPPAQNLESPPTEEERRNAARIMRRLFRSRRDPEEAEH